MLFCDELRILKENQNVILSNACNGAWIRISEEIYKLIKYIIENDNDEIIQEYRKEDALYINKVISLMKKIGILDYVDSSAIKNVDFAITSLCNMKCKHCSNSIMNYCRNLTFDEVKCVIDTLVYAGVENLTITGGEPLMKKEFYSIVDYLYKKFKTLQLMTNGTMISCKNVKFICDNFTSISISLDGYDEESCDLIRGDGTYKRVVNAIQLLQSYGFEKIDLSSVENVYNNIDKFYLLCEELKVTPLVRRYAPLGRGEKNANELFLKLLDSECEEKKLLAEYISDNNINYGYKNNATTVCSAYRHSIYIGADLCIYPCGALNMPEFKGDNILEIKDIKEYFTKKIYLQTEGYKFFNDIKPENASYCGGCSISIFCNDCPAYLYLYNKNGYLTTYCEKCKEYMKRKIYE